MCVQADTHLKNLFFYCSYQQADSGADKDKKCKRTDKYGIHRKHYDTAFSHK